MSDKREGGKGSKARSRKRTRKRGTPNRKRGGAATLSEHAAASGGWGNAASPSEGHLGPVGPREEGAEALAVPEGREGLAQELHLQRVRRAE